MVEMVAQGPVEAGSYTRREQNDNGFKQMLRFLPEQAYPKALDELSKFKERYSETGEVKTTSLKEMLGEAELIKWTIKVLSFFELQWRV